MENDNNPESVNEEAVNDSLFPDMTFEALPEELKNACGRAGWDKLMPVQQKAIPYLLNDRDVMVQARTGSGKTGAFVLPLLDKLDPESRDCQALVMVPTRELAQQVAQEARMLAGDAGINVVAVYGGVGYQQQLDAFREGAQLVVGTPGRILDHLVRRSLNLGSLKVLLFDEADRMLSVGFYPDMVEVKRYLPRKINGAYMFSATFPQSVLRLAKEFMYEPEFLSLSSDETNVTSIAHQFVEVEAMGKERKLIKLIELENPSSAVIFSNTKRNVEFIAALLSQFGFDAEGLTSDLTQNKREKLMARIKEGKLRFLVATDVAARGIDIPELSHVFMMEPPEDPESYVHRAGRTGRAGASGVAITLVDVIQKMELERIASRFKIKFEEIKNPTDEDVAAIIDERLTALLEKQFRKLKPLERERASRFLPLVKKFAEDDESMGLLAMLLDEIYQNTLHGKPVEPVVKQEQPAQPKQGKPKQKRSRGRKPGNGEGQGRRSGNGGGPKKEQPKRESKPEARSEKPKREKRDEPRQERKESAPRQEKPSQAASEEGDSKSRPRRRRRRRPRRR
ncbi:DEAD/DEAH box helicase [Pseudodesulfovibrio sp. zrk46]|uniref:DEAD/DEAH box helicase n=1 Tax=Pseudodesulfovibrio sp. zrk46 TaxID=2725288 RepID=UPI00144938A6|nr:DEAD/DEAH box helicase [Pseudodesulfovibrio sp. zrk46]QJB54975.1 DEAD/DEAH box helicase [Pseudodesulfovibrio sp. zrk46]